MKIEVIMTAKEPAKKSAKVYELSVMTEKEAQRLADMIANDITKMSEENYVVLLDGKEYARIEQRKIMVL